MRDSNYIYRNLSQQSHTFQVSQYRQLLTMRQSINRHRRKIRSRDMSLLSSQAGT